MDLRSGEAFWPIKNGLINTFPRLNQSMKAEVVILGGGITGALIANEFSKRGIEVIILEKREVGWGSTSASTAMLQYEIDEDLCDLQDKIGTEQAVHAYKEGVEAINQLEKLCLSGENDCGFKKHPSLYISRTEDDFKQLEKEFKARQKAGFAVSWLGGKELNQTYGLRAEAAIKSEVAAVVDAYQLTHKLFNASVKRGVQIFDKTEVVNIQKKAKGYSLKTSEGYEVEAGHLIFATGYESTNYLKQDVVDLKSTYALATEPLDVKKVVGGQYLMWEMARPYFYMRPTEDSRLLMGGEDIAFKNPKVREAALSEKIEKICDKFRELYPDAPALEVAFTWAGTFGETKDGLPYIGESPEWPQADFALGYGGNGITYSLLASKIIADRYQNIPNKDLKLYGFGR